MNLFVYGTLMSGLNNCHFLSNSKMIGTGDTEELYSLHVSGSIPFLHDDEKLYKVKGEVYIVQNDTLKDIDLIESNGSWYNRKKIIVNVDNVQYECQTYFNNEKAVKLNHGDFREYIDEMTRQLYNVKVNN